MYNFFFRANDKKKNRSNAYVTEEISMPNIDINAIICERNDNIL